MGNEVLNLACLGLGRLGHRHAENIANKITGARLFAVCDVQEERAKQVAEELQVPHAFSDYEEMLSLDEIDAVVIVSPSDFHVDHIRLALAAGKHVYCEKPLSTKIDACREAVELVADYPRQHFFLGFMRRYDPSYMEVKKRIEAGEIGRPILFRGYSQDPIKGIQDALRFSETSGGLFYDMSVHDIDLARWLLEGEAREVYALGDCYAEPGFAQYNDCDNASCLMKFDNGAMAFLFAGRTAPHGYNVETEVIGTAGILRVASVPSRSHVEILDEYGVRRECHVDFLERFQDAYVNEIQVFVDGLRKGLPRAEGPTAIDGLGSALIAEACTQSLRQQKLVKVDPIAGI